MRGPSLETVRNVAMTLGGLSTFAIATGVGGPGRNRRDEEEARKAQDEARKAQDDAKKAENKHYATILTPDKYQQYLFSEALIKKANENKHDDSILTNEEIKEKRINEIQEILNNTSIFLHDLDRLNLNRELERLIRRNNNNNNSEPSSENNNSENENQESNTKHF
jgi:hypothetical protein